MEKVAIPGRLPYCDCMIEPEVIKNMSPIEKLQTMELLWNSLADVRDETPSPVWHESIISGRIEKIEKGEAVFLTLEQVKQRLQKPV